MDNNLRNLCEQIQEGILTYADSGLVTLSQENLDDLCEIVVRNFRKFDPDGYFPLVQEKQPRSFLIEEIEFDVSGSEDGYRAPGEWSEQKLQERLQKEWRGQITEPLLEEEIADYISDRSGWCVSHLEYSTLTPAAEQK